MLLARRYRSVVITGDACIEAIQPVVDQVVTSFQGASREYLSCGTRVATPRRRTVLPHQALFHGRPRIIQLQRHVFESSHALLQMAGALGSTIIVELCFEKIRLMAIPLTLQHIRTAELLNILLLDLLKNEVHTVLVYLLLGGTVHRATWIVAKRSSSLYWGPL